MRSLPLFLARRQLGHRRLRTLTVATVVALSTWCVATVVVLDRATIAKRKWDRIIGGGDPDVVLEFPEATLARCADTLRRIRADEDVEAALGYLLWTPPEPGRDGVYVVWGDVGPFCSLQANRIRDPPERVLAGPFVEDPTREFQLGPLTLRPEGKLDLVFFTRSRGARAPRSAVSDHGSRDRRWCGALLQPGSVSRDRRD